MKPTAIQLFLVPDRELSLKFYADNLRTVAVAMALLTFAAKFRTFGISILIPACAQRMEWCLQSVASAEDMFVKANWIVTAIQYSMMALGFLFAAFAIFQSLEAHRRVLMESVALYVGHKYSPRGPGIYDLFLIIFTMLYPLLLLMASGGLTYVALNAA